MRSQKPSGLRFNGPCGQIRSLCAKSNASFCLYKPTTIQRKPRGCRTLHAWVRCRRSSSFVVAKSYSRSEHRYSQWVIPEKVDILCRSFKYEASKGLCNSKGSILFSQFVVSELEHLIAQSQTNDEKVKYAHCLSGFKRYETLRLDQRREHVAKANSILGGPPISFPRLPPPLKSGLEDRLASNGKASTSSSQTEAVGLDRLRGNQRQLKCTNSKGGLLTTHSGHLSVTSPAERLVESGQTPVLNGRLPSQSAAAEQEASVNGHPEDTHFSSQAGAQRAIGQEAEFTQGAAENGILPPIEEIDVGQTLFTEVVIHQPVTGMVCVQTDSQVATDEAFDQPEPIEQQQRKLRASFDASALEYVKKLSEVKRIRQAATGHDEQRTTAWHAMRDGRLTASSFSNALGFWKDGRTVLWEEKVGLSERFQGNDATRWGTRREPEALDRYKEVTGHAVDSMSFMIHGETLPTSWLGASPDGLLTPLPRGQLRQSPYVKTPQGQGLGILEIKCPFNKGQPQKAKTYDQAPYYYMPQVQGLMEIFDRDWCNLFVYTVNEAVIYHIKRDSSYWADIYKVMAEFWWFNVISAKHACLLDSSLDLEEFRPSDKHIRTDYLMDWSKEMAAKADSCKYPPKLQFAY